MGLTSTFDEDQVDREACPLFAVEVAPDREVLGNFVLLVQSVEEASAFDRVVALRSLRLVLPQLATQNQHGSTVIFQAFQSAKGDRVVNLSCPSAVARNFKPLDFAVFVNNSKRWVSDDNIDLFWWSVIAGIVLGQVAVAALFQFGKAIVVQFVGDDIGGICSNQQRSISGSGFVDRGIRADASESGGKVGDRDWGAVRLLENGGGRSDSQRGLTIEQIDEVVIGLVGCRRLGNQEGGNADDRGFHCLINRFGEWASRENGCAQDFLSLVPRLVNAGVTFSLP